MSLSRLVYYSAVIGGWAAFLGWLAAECLVLRGEGTRGGLLGQIIVGALVGAAIGAGINVVSGISNTQLKTVLFRAVSGLIVASIGGAIGILLGNLMYAIGLPRALGFMALGLGVGIVDGLYERSLSKLRNGVIGGLIGGLVGGFLFDPLATLIASDTGIASRATAFVILGLCIGALIGFTQVVFREAWLTVMDGYRPGRQLILSRSVTVLGRADHLPLPFIGPANVDVEPEHLRIVRQANGSYAVEDNESRLGISVNHQQVQGSRPLHDGDVIKMGGNFIRFNERRKKAAGQSSGDQPMTPAVPQQQSRPKTPPPPAAGKPKPPGGAAAKPASTPRTRPASPASKQPAKPQSGKAVKGPPPPPPPPGKRRT